MVFVEPYHVFLDEKVGNQDDSLVFELQSLPGVSKIAIGVGNIPRSIFSLAAVSTFTPRQGFYCL